MMVLEKNNYKLGEPLIIKMYYDQIKDMSGDITIEVIHIYDWYDEVFNINTHGEIKNHELECIVNHHLEKGFYALRYIKINNILIYGYDDRFDISSNDYFSISMEGIPSNYAITHKKIIEARENEFAKNKLLDSGEGHTLFDAYVFVKNIRVKSRIQYGSIEAIPFDNLGNESEVLNVDSFFKAINLSLDLSHIINTKGRPTAVFYIKNIVATNGRQAELYAIEMAETLSVAFTLTTRGNGEIYAIAILNTVEQTSCVNVLNRIYTGDLLLLGDQGFTIRKYYEAFLNSSSLKFYVQLLNEAEREHNMIYKYYKLWLILEGLAKTKNYVGRDMRKWNGDYIVDKKGLRVRITDESLNIVFELTRNHFSHEAEQIVLKNGKSISRKDFLSICYQRRCCCAHHGKCFMDNPTICDSSKAQCVRCKENNIRENFFQSKYEDEILVKFENMVYSIVQKEVQSEVGIIIKEQNLVASFLENQ